MLVLAVVAPPAPAAQSLGVASGVDALLSTRARVLDRGAQVGAQTVACGDAALSQQEKNTRQMDGSTCSSTEVAASHHLSTCAKMHSNATTPR